MLRVTHLLRTFEVRNIYSGMAKIIDFHHKMKMKSIKLRTFLEQKMKADFGVDRNQISEKLRKEMKRTIDASLARAIFIRALDRRRVCEEKCAYPIDRSVRTGLFVGGMRWLMPRGVVPYYVRGFGASSSLARSFVCLRLYVDRR